MSKNPPSRSESIKRKGSVTSEASFKLDLDVFGYLPMNSVRPILQWPEWSDSEVNSERWDCKVLLEKDRRKRSSRPTITTDGLTTLFTDDHVELPSSLKVNEWKRPSDLFTSPDECVLYVQRDDLSLNELIYENQHIIHSEFVRSVLASILTVWHLGSRERFPIEGETSTFVSNTKHLCWRPWHHLYSLCKAGKHKEHDPRINPSGKYIVRLYFMGCWRKIYVDDRIPIDDEGGILLPWLSKSNELWLLLLTKALMKLGSLTWTSDKELVEFNPIICLTGWIGQEFNTKRISVDEAWAMCNDIVHNYSDSEEHESTKVASDCKLETTTGHVDIKRGSKAKSVVSNLTGNSKDTVNKKKSNLVLNSKGEKSGSKEKKKSVDFDPNKSSPKHTDIKGSRGKSSALASTKTRSYSVNGSPKLSSQGRSPSVVSHSKTITKMVYDVSKLNKEPVLCASLADHWPMMNVKPPVDSSLSLSHAFLILQTRDTAFVCQKPRPGILGWKRYRWVDWAFKSGLFDPDLLLPFRSVQIVSLFSDWIDKIEEKDNQIAMEEANASGDPGGSYSGQKLAREIKIEAINHHYNGSTGITEKQNLNTESSIQDGKIGQHKLVEKTKAKIALVTSASVKSKRSYLEAILSHRYMQYEHPEESVITAHVRSIWTDFNHIWPSLDKMVVFYKPSAFRYKINILNFTLNQESSKTGIQSANHKKINIKNTIQYVNIPFTGQQSRNDGVYLTFDSVECIKVLFKLSAIPVDAIRLNSIPTTWENRDQYHSANSANNTDRPSLIPQKKAAPVNVLIEVYDWASNRFNKTILVLESLGSKSTTLTLAAGRHVLRLWIKSDTAFILQCFSESYMTAGNIFKAVNAMCNYSERTFSFLNEMRGKLSNLMMAFGKPHFVNALHAVFRSINTISSNNNKYLVHELFMGSVLETLKSFIGTEQTLIEYIFTMRVLFLNVSLGLPKKSTTLMDDLVKNSIADCSVGNSIERHVIYSDQCSEGDANTLLSVWLTMPSDEKIYKHAACLIQTTWKRYCVLRLMKLHRNTHTKEHKLMVEKLRKIHDIFKSASNGDLVNKILRTMFELNPDVARSLSLHHDFALHVKTEEYQGELVNISPCTWVPVVRAVVHCHSDTPMGGAVNVVCQFPRYMVRVIDNDNLVEKPRMVFNVEPCTYSKNTNGFTIFVYAWSEKMIKEVQWKLQIITMKDSPSIHSCTNPTQAEPCTVNKPPSLMTIELSNYYIPNRENVICCLLITVKKKMLVSFRLTSSFKGAKFTACLKDNAGFPLLQIQAEGGAAIIPAVLLEGEKNSEDKFYILEAKVVRNSWPLSRQEWIVQERIRNEFATYREKTITYKFTNPSGTSVISKKQGSSKTLVGSRKPTEVGGEFSVENPFWVVQTIVDHHQRDLIEVKQDRRWEEAAAAMKKAWEVADPGRAKRGQALRETFIRQTYGHDHDHISPERRFRIRGRSSSSTRHESHTSAARLHILEGSTERYQNPPEDLVIARQSKSHFLKLIGEYLVTDKREPFVKTRELHERELLENRKRQQEFFEGHEKDVDERKRVLIEQRRKHVLMNAHYARVKSQSKRLIKSAYMARDDYVRNKIEEEKNVLKKPPKKKSAKKSAQKRSPKKKKGKKRSRSNEKST